MMFRTRAALMAAVVSFAGFAAAGADARTIRIGLITPPPHVWTQAANRIAERLPEATGGALTVEVFPAGQLGTESDMLQQIGSGLLDGGIITAGITSLRAPSLNGWFTPYLFENVAAAGKAAETDAAQAMLAELEPVGLVGLGYTFAGMRHVLMRTGAADSMEDLASKKIRIVPFPAMKVWWGEIGAVPTPVQLTEVYQALQSGVIDGVDIDLDALVGLKFQDVADTLTLTNHMAWPAVAIVSRATWASLSDEEREAVRAVFDEAMAWATAQQIEAETRNLETVKGDIEVIEMDGETSFAAANAAFQEEYGDVGLVAEFQEQARAAGE